MRQIVHVLPLLALAGMARAEPLPLHTYPIADLGIELSNYRYEEQVGGAFFMANEGSKIGLNASFSQPLANSWFWGAQARHAYGSVSYTSASSGSKGDNPDVLTDVRITGGKDHAVGTQVLAPYFGLGYRLLFNDLRGTTTTGAAGYRRQSQYVYLPLGITHRMRMGDSSRLSTQLEYDLLLHGRQQSFLSDIQPTPPGICNNDPVNTQRAGYGWRLALDYETVRWSFGLFLHHWHLSDSDQVACLRYGVPIGLVTEPANSTREVGVALKLRFR